MDKILLILKREYISRVKKKSFLLTTFLTPLLIGGLYAGAIYLTVSESDKKIVKVIDESNLFAGKLKNRNAIEFEFVAEGLEQARKSVSSGDFYGLLYIPDFDLDRPDNINFYTLTTPGMEALKGVNRALETVVREEKLKRLGISPSALDSAYTDINVNGISLSGDEEKQSSSGVAGVAGMVSGMLIYIFMLVYGAQVMRGVMQEKTSKIVEILVSSVKPFQLMMGKILGIALVGLTQFILWFALTFVVVTVAGPLIGIDAQAMATEQAGAMTNPEQQSEALAMITEVIGSLNIPLLLASFLFYFLTGYLFYAALFAMIGSAVDSEADTQQFMLPIMLPIIASMMFMGVVLKDPSGPISFWLSMIPFSSPIIMMMRIPFGVPAWQLLLSMALMVLGFLGTTWIAGRVYRIGILMYGTKVNYKVLAKWFMMKG
jgi:ABC-2 type transport system permease protein